jgi:hypothetical protein
VDILRNQMLIFRYKALFGLLFAVILNYEAASELRGIFGRGGRVPEGVAYMRKRGQRWGGRW